VESIMCVVNSVRVGSTELAGLVGPEGREVREVGSEG
jgi:hypothetical protein